MDKGAVNLIVIALFLLRSARYDQRLVLLSIVAEAHVHLQITVVVSEGIVTSTLAIRDGCVGEGGKGWQRSQTGVSGGAWQG